MKIPNINTLTSLPSYSYIKANQNSKRFANTTCSFSAVKTLPPSVDKYDDAVTSVESVCQFYPSRYIDKYVSHKVIKNAIKTNPNITKILNEHGLTPRISNKNINEKAKMHMFNTYICAKKIGRVIKLDDKKAQNLYQAALLHDIGKALIPERIVQKPGKLTPEERKIIDLHSKLGYEILKTTDVPKEVAELVRGHHDPRNKKTDNIYSLILSVCDVYSALKEKRAYKPAMQDKEAFEIMSSSDKLSQVFVHILKGYKFRE